MSDTDDIAPEDADRVLAAEYVLGVLGADERRAVETRMAQEAAFAREVAVFRRHSRPRWWSSLSVRAAFARIARAE